MSTRYAATVSVHFDGHAERYVLVPLGEDLQVKSLPWAAAVKDAIDRLVHVIPKDAELSRLLIDVGPDTSDARRESRY